MKNFRFAQNEGDAITHLQNFVVAIKTQFNQKDGSSGIQGRGGDVARLTSDFSSNSNFSRHCSPDMIVNTTKKRGQNEAVQKMMQYILKRDFFSIGILHDKR